MHSLNKLLIIQSVPQSQSQLCGPIVELSALMAEFYSTIYNISVKTSCQRVRSEDWPR